MDLSQFARGAASSSSKYSELQVMSQCASTASAVLHAANTCLSVRPQRIAPLMWWWCGRSWSVSWASCAARWILRTTQLMCFRTRQAVLNPALNILKLSFVEAARQTLTEAYCLPFDLQIQKYKAYKQKRAKKGADRTSRDLGNVILKHGTPESAYLAAEATEVRKQ